MRSVLEAGAYQTIERFEVTSANVVPELESIKILDKGDAHMTLKEEESVSQFNEVLKFDGEGYEALLLRKGDAHHWGQTTSKWSRELIV